MEDKTNELQIKAYLHCGKCIEERPPELSAQEWQRLDIGWTEKGLQVWCVRHDCNVVNIDFEGQTHPADDTAAKTTSTHHDLADMDIDAMFNLREWVEDALEKQGATITDGGMGMGGADIGITIEGMPFGLTVRPRPLYKGDYSELP